jgi:hypothetical protein
LFDHFRGVLNIIFNRGDVTAQTLGFAASQFSKKFLFGELVESLLICHQARRSQNRARVDPWAANSAASVFCRQSNGKGTPQSLRPLLTC